GRREPIRLSKGDWAKWLVAEGESAPPAPLAEVYSELAKANAELVVMRDALQKMPRRLKGDIPLDDALDISRGVSDERIAILKLTVEELNGRIAQLKPLAEKADGLEGIIAKLELSILEEAKAMTPTERAARVSELQVAHQNRLAEQIVARTERD